MKVLGVVAATVFALSLAGQSFAQQTNQPQQQDSDHKPAAVVAPDAAAGAASGSVSPGVILGVGAVIAVAIAVGVSGGGNGDNHGSGTTGTH